MSIQGFWPGTKQEFKVLVLNCYFYLNDVILTKVEHRTKLTDELRALFDLQNSSNTGLNISQSCLCHYNSNE